MPASARRADDGAIDSRNVHAAEWAGAAVAIVLVAALFSFRPVYEPDLWWHLAQGREDAAGRLVRSNVFSYAHGGYRQHYTSWLFDTLAFAAWSRYQDAGVQALQACLLALTLALAYLACRCRAGVAAAVAVLVLGLFVVEPRAIPRPHLASLAGVSACAWLIARAVEARSVRPLLWTIPVVALWSNLHVEAVTGVLLLGCVAAGEAVRPSFLSRRDALVAVEVVFACALALMANPYGAGIYRYFYENISVPQIISIAELQPPYLPAYRAFFAYSAILTILLLAQPSRLRLWEVLLTAVLAAAGFRFLRLTPLLFLATAPIAAARLGAWIPRPLDARAVVITALAAAGLLSRAPLTSYVAGLRVGGGALSTPSVFSPGAVAFLRTSGIRGPMFNSFNLGGYLAWTLYPAGRTFQDSRLQAYPPSHFPSIMAASESQASWNALVTGLDYAVVARQRPNQLSGVGMFPEPDWRLAYRDEAVDVYVRKKLESR